jgi:hypothetical protein
MKAAGEILGILARPATKCATRLATHGCRRQKSQADWLLVVIKSGTSKMEYLIGLILAVATACFALVVGLARERSFYPPVLIVIGSYYVLFAAMGASTRTILTESVVAGIFVLFAAIGFRGNLWFVAAATIGHGAFDFVHHFFIDNPGVPHFWPGFCLAYDAVFGVFLALWLIRHPRLSRAQP